MKDLFRDYKKQNTRKNGMIIALSLVFAFSINTFLFGTDMGSRLQTSVLNSSGKASASPADLVIVNAGTGTDMLKIKSQSHLEKVSRIYLSLAFDPESASIADVFSSDKEAEGRKNSNIAGTSSITILFKKPKDIVEGTELVTLVYKKKNATKTVLNLAETQFKSADGTLYELSNSPLEF